MEERQGQGAEATASGRTDACIFHLRYVASSVSTTAHCDCKEDFGYMIDLSIEEKDEEMLSCIGWLMDCLNGTSQVSRFATSQTNKLKYPSIVSR